MTETKDVTLFYHPASYFSQKAAIGLKEKGVEFEGHIVCPSGTYETYQPWFMRINPNGQVPVLQHGNAYIPDSVKIIQYLDDHFEGSKLIPDPNSKEGQLCNRLVALLDSVRVGPITYGVVANLKFSEGLELPEYYVQYMKEDIEKGTRLEALKRHQRENPDLFEDYEKKIVLFSKFGMKLKDEAFVEHNIQAVKGVFEEIEKHLSSAKVNLLNSWLCGGSFSIADITLAVLLRRVRSVGIQRLVLEDGQHPHLMQYYERLKERRSFQEACVKPFAE